MDDLQAVKVQDSQNIVLVPFALQTSIIKLIKTIATDQNSTVRPFLQDQEGSTQSKQATKSSTLSK